MIKNLSRFVDLYLREFGHEAASLVETVLYLDFYILQQELCNKRCLWMSKQYLRENRNVCIKCHIGVGLWPYINWVHLQVIINLSVCRIWNLYVQAFSSYQSVNV